MSAASRPPVVHAALFIAAACAILAAAAWLRFRGLDVSLYEDEVWVANLVKHGGWHPHSWATPPLFYLLERGWAALRGTSDGALREMPALFGVILVAAAFLAPVAPIARFVLATLFAFSSPLVFYSTRMKQYTLEATICMLIIVLSLRALQTDGRRDWILFLAVAALGVTTLYSPLFIAGAALFAVPPKRIPLIAGVIALGLIAYSGWLAPGPESVRLHGDLTEFFARNGRWVTSPRIFLRSSADWVGQALNLVRFGWLALLLAAAWIVRTRDRAVAALLILPPLAVAAASTLRIYPYGEIRLMIFCFPALYIAIACGIAWIAARVPLVLVVLIPFALHAQTYNQTYMRVTDQRAVYDAIARAHKPGEPIIVGTSVAAPLRYHHPELAPDIREVNRDVSR